MYTGAYFCSDQLYHKTGPFTFFGALKDIIVLFEMLNKATILDAKVAMLDTDLFAGNGTGRHAPRIETVPFFPKRSKLL